MPSKNRKKKAKALHPGHRESVKELKSKIIEKTPVRGRIWLFRLASVIIVPLLLFTLLEIGLRLGGYGYPTQVFIKAGDSGTYRTNIEFGWRFFPRNLARAPLYKSIRAKPQGTIRIFILGESAAQGVPDPAFGFGPILEIMLRERYPGVKFDVVNAAMTAINSHVVLEIARDCAAHQPDLFVIYMGNNEVIGPFGPGTVFQKWSPSLPLIRANIRMKSLRLTQLLDDATSSFNSRKNSHGWRGVEMFMGNPVAADDPRLAAVYENFRRNLVDICSEGRSADAAVILSTVGANLRDCPPFISQHRAGILNADLDKWKSLYSSGIELEDNRNWPEALAKYEAAAQIDDRYAELHFRMGRCLEGGGRFREAKEKFQAALDLDALRFRADTIINKAIREVAAAQEKHGIYLADPEQSLSANSVAAGSIPGSDLFYEHVHLTFEGNHFLAGSILGRVETALPQLARFRKTDSILSKEQCADALLLTPWDERHFMAQMAEMISRPPFTNQLDYRNRIDAMRSRVNSLSIRLSTHEAFQDIRKRFESALEKAPDDWNLRYRLAKLLLEIDEPEPAAHHLNIALKQYPWNPELYNALGVAKQRSGHSEEAIANYRKAIEMYPYAASFYSGLGAILADLGQNDEAIANFERMLEIDPGSETARIWIGNIRIKQEDFVEAADQYKKALEINPANVETNRLLGLVLAKQGRPGAAVDYLERALKLDPVNEPAHFNLGEALYNLGRYPEAAAHFQKNVEINPQNAVAYYWLGKIMLARGQTGDAVENFRRALDINPNFAEARIELQALLAR